MVGLAAIGADRLDVAGGPGDETAALLAREEDAVPGAKAPTLELETSGGELGFRERVVYCLEMRKGALDGVSGVRQPRTPDRQTPCCEAMDRTPPARPTADKSASQAFRWHVSGVQLPS